jgi:hypothetical protein
MRVAIKNDFPKIENLLLLFLTIKNENEKKFPKMAGFWELGKIKFGDDKKRQFSYFFPLPLWVGRA